MDSDLVAGSPVRWHCWQMRELKDLLAAPETSSYRALVLEQVFCSEVLQAAWKVGLPVLEIDRPFVDFKGYDLVMTSGKVTRHVQLKGVYPANKTGTVDVQLALADKPAGCVVLMFLDVDASGDRIILSYRLFGRKGPDPLVFAPGLKVTTRSRPNSDGVKLDRDALRQVPYRRNPREPEDGFGPLMNVDELVVHMFGDPQDGD